MYIIILTRLILMAILMFRSLMEEMFIVTSRDVSTGPQPPLTRWFLRLLQTISTLPLRIHEFLYWPNPYYYFNGIFYKPHANQYQVVAPPLGAVVNKLPSGAKIRVIDGQKYYELNGTFYKKEIGQDNRLSYRVVGTDGVLNTNPDNKKIQQRPRAATKEIYLVI